MYNRISICNLVLCTLLEFCMIRDLEKSCSHQFCMYLQFTCCTMIFFKSPIVHTILHFVTQVDKEKLNR